MSSIKTIAGGVFVAYSLSLVPVNKIRTALQSENSFVILRLKYYEARGDKLFEYYLTGGHYVFLAGYGLDENGEISSMSKGYGDGEHDRFRIHDPATPQGPEFQQFYLLSDIKIHAPLIAGGLGGLYNVSEPEAIQIVSGIGILQTAVVFRVSHP